MGLVIRVPRRLRLSRRFKFGDDVDLVVIGRDPDRCQIMFPPRTRAVGLEHVGLKRVLGRYRLVLNAEDPVFVNGHEAVDGQELPDRCVLRLGARGPRLVVERTARTDLPPSERVMASHGRSASPRRLLSSVRLTRRLALGSAVLVILVAGLLVWSTWRPEGPPDPTEEAALRAALERAAPSVYRVVVRTADGGEYSGATAWVVAPGRLATNAHVARQLELLPPGGRLQVRSSDSRPRTYDVRSVTIHPGFDAFEALWDGYQPAEGARAGRLHRIPSAGAGADVALLDVDPDTPLGPALPLADERELVALAPGDRVGYVGYPSEALALSGSPVQRPVAHRQLGRITLMTNLFGAQGEPASSHLIQHTCPGTGGSSGSPLLDARGRVIGIVSAGNFARGMMGRIPSGVGINFAQRVDLLQELLDGNAEERQAERNVAWSAAIEELYPSAWRIERRRAIERLLEGLSRDQWRRSGDTETIVWTLVTTLLVEAGVDPPADADRSTMAVLQGGRHLLVASPRLQRVTSVTATFVPEEGPPTVLVERDGALDFEATGPGVLHVAVTALDRPVPVELLLHHGQVRPLTPVMIREGIRADWSRDLERQPWLEVDPDPTTVHEAVLRLGDLRGPSATGQSTLTCQEAGVYLVLAVAWEPVGITLGVDGLATGSGRDPAGLSLGRSRYRTFEGWGAEGSEVAIRVGRVPGVAADVAVEVTVWLARSRR